MEIIGDRDPWELMYRASLHVLDRIHRFKDVKEWETHGLACITHSAILQCCEAIRLAGMENDVY